MVIQSTANFLGIHPCNKTTESANASGIFTYSVPYENSTANVIIPDPSWALTVDEYSDDLRTSLWYSTAGQNYSNDLALGYDVCAYSITDVSLNTVELGQDDPAIAVPHSQSSAGRRL
jgi:hypothetical protein